MTTTLITGASSGIGLELAKQFASGGDNVVLVARSEGKLQNLADQIHAEHQVRADVIPADLTKPDGVDKLCEQLLARSIHVDTLVNNAGFGALGKFAELSVDRQTDMVMVNVLALTRLTRMLLPEMQQRLRGGILNVGSTAAYQAGPNMSVYYATKAYVLSFTEGLREELAGTGLHVTCLEPGPTESGFGEDSGMGKLNIFTSSLMTSQVVAKAGRIVNAGQSCVASKRLIVVQSVADAFIADFKEQMAAPKMGDPTFDQELFGPVATIYVVKDEAAAIELANKSSYGLSGSVFTADIERGRRVAEQVETGMMFLNQPTKSQADLPFGGIKNSGYGRELSHLGILEFVNKKLIHLGS